MGEFIKVAKDLEVKDISKGVEIPNEEVDTEETVVDDEEKISGADVEPIETEDVTKESEETDDPKLTPDKKIRHRQTLNQISSDAKSPECPDCGKVFTKRNTMLKHYRIKHIQSYHESIKYPCNQCDYEFTSQCSLKRHIQSQHECIKYPCNQCDYQGATKGSLQAHIQSKHEGIKYPCND